MAGASCGASSARCVAGLVERVAPHAIRVTVLCASNSRLPSNFLQHIALVRFNRRSDVGSEWLGQRFVQGVNSRMRHFKGVLSVGGTETAALVVISAVTARTQFGRNAARIGHLVIAGIP